MADLGLQPMPVLVGGQVGRQRVRRVSLADAGDIVELAFDSQQRGVANGAAVDLAIYLAYFTLTCRLLWFI